MHSMVKLHDLVDSDEPPWWKHQHPDGHRTKPWTWMPRWQNGMRRWWSRWPAWVKQIWVWAKLSLYSHFVFYFDACSLCLRKKNLESSYGQTWNENNDLFCDYEVFGFPMLGRAPSPFELGTKHPLVSG